MPSIKQNEVAYFCLLKGHVSDNTKVSQNSFKETEKTLQSNTAVCIVSLYFKKGTVSAT